MSEEKYEIVVIGAGPGGYVAAIRAAQLGFKVACVEKRKALGGTCLNVGCIPSKALLQSTEHYHVLDREGKEFGIEYDKLKPNLKQMMKRKDHVVKGLQEGIGTLFAKHRITSIFGSARFISPSEIEVDSKTVSGKYFILATGSEPIPLPFLPFDEKRIVSSTGALELKEIPKRLVVIGGGVIGVELASVYARIGSEVIVVEMMDEICPMTEPLVSKTLRTSLEKLGITFHLGTQVSEADLSKKEVVLTIKKGSNSQELKTDVVLVSVGRRPFNQGLGLAEARVKTTERGYVIVDDVFRTSTPHIYAIGDVIEGLGLAHRASEEGVAVAELIAGMQPKVHYMAIPNVIYTEPEVAAVGLTEAEAKAMGLKVRVGSYPFRGNPRARCGGVTDGLVKVIAEAESDRLIGMHIVGANASEMIHAGMVAIEEKATLLTIGQMPFAHPTLSEVIKEAALQAHKRVIHG